MTGYTLLKESENYRNSRLVHNISMSIRAYANRYGSDHIGCNSTSYSELVLNLGLFGFIESGQGLLVRNKEN